MASYSTFGGPGINMNNLPAWQRTWGANPFNDYDQSGMDLGIKAGLRAPEKAAYPTWGNTAGTGTLTVGGSPTGKFGGDWASFAAESAGANKAAAPAPAIPRQKTISDTMNDLFGTTGGTPGSLADRAKTAGTPPVTAPAVAAPRPSPFGDIDIAALFKEWLNPTSKGSSTASGSSTTANPWATEGAALVRGSLAANTGQLNQALAANQAKYSAMKEDAARNPGVGGGVADSLMEQINREEANSAAEIQQRFANQQQNASASAGSRLLSAGQQEQQFKMASDRAAESDRATKFNQLMSMLGLQANQANRGEDVDFRNLQANREQDRYQLQTAMNQQRYEQGLMTADEERAYEREQRAQGIARGEQDKAYAADVRRFEFENQPRTGQLAQIGTGNRSSGGGSGGSGGRAYDGSSWRGGGMGGKYVGLGGATSPLSKTFSGSNQSQFSSDVPEYIQRARTQLLNGAISPTLYS